MSLTRPRETILVVDQEHGLRIDLCRILRAEGYVAIPAGRGIEAHWCVEQHGTRVDLLVADLAHPEADGYHLGLPIGRLFPRVPALFLSTASREEHVRSGILHPHAHFLRRPFPPPALTRKVRAVLDGPCLSPLM